MSTLRIMSPSMFILDTNQVNVVEVPEHVLPKILRIFVLNFTKHEPAKKNARIRTVLTNLRKLNDLSSERLKHYSREQLRKKLLEFMGLWWKSVRSQMKYGQLTIIATKDDDKVKPTYATTRVATEDKLTVTTSGALVLNQNKWQVPRLA